MQRTILVIGVLIMIGLIVGVDVLFFRGNFWARLATNLGIVLVALGMYLRFLK